MASTYVVTTTGASASVSLKDIGLIDPLVHPASLDLISKGISMNEIEDSTDLYDALTAGYLTATFNGVSVVAGVDVKQDKLVSGTNIKTINGSSLLGSGDLTITDLVGLGDPGGNGIVVRTAYNTTTNRSVTSTGSTVTVTNGSGVSGNINVDLPNVGTSGSYVSVTTDAQGRVSSGSSTQAWSTISSTPTTLAGYGIGDAAPLSHVGSGGTAHSNASITTAGFMSAPDKSKLDGIAAGAQPGTVTTVSVVSANGLAGTVATDTTTPAITLSTSITGVLVGNGTGVAAAVSATDVKSITVGTAAAASILGAGTITTGDVTGPASSTDKAIPTFSGTGGKTLQNNSVTINASGSLGSVQSVKNNVITGASQPSTPANGETYFDGDYNTLMYYDSTRAKWLSIESYTFTVAANSSIGAGISLQQAGGLATSTTPIPVGSDNVCLVGVRVATSVNENWTLGIADIATGGSATTYTLAIPNGTVYSNHAVNQNFTAGDALDTYVSALGSSGNVNRPSVTYILKKRK